MRVLSKIIFTAAMLVAANALAGQTISLVAGGGQAEADGIPATQFRLKEPFGVDFDRSGNMYIVEMAAGQRVLKVNRDGIINRFAGTGRKGAGGDGGPAREASFDGIHNLAIAPNGDIYLADTWNCRIRKIEGPTGVISTVVGTGEKGFDGDGDPGAAAKLGGIYCASLDPQGKNLYLADLHNVRIRKVELGTGRISTVAGNGQKGIPPDGAIAAEASLSDPRAVAVDRRGQIYILERGGHALRVVDAAGKIRTVVNASGLKGMIQQEEESLAARMNGPKHLCLDLEENVIIADAENHLIVKYLPARGKVVRIAGTGRAGRNGVGGDPLTCELNRPHGVLVRSNGDLYITDSYNDRILRVTNAP